MKYNEFQLYVMFRRAQSNFLDRPYRLPKDWDKFINQSNKKNIKEILEKLANYFNTKWSNINPEKYFEWGFELLKNKFTYYKFFDKTVLQYYIRKDKVEKIKMNANKIRIVNSAKFIRSYMRTIDIRNDLSLLSQYSKLKHGFNHICIEHYRQQKIDTHMFVYLLHEKYLVLSELEWQILIQISTNLKTLMREVSKIKPFMKKVEEILNEKRKRI